MTPQARKRGDLQKCVYLDGLKELRPPGALKRPLDGVKRAFGRGLMPFQGIQRAFEECNGG